MTVSHRIKHKRLGWSKRLRILYGTLPTKSTLFWKMHTPTSVKSSRTGSHKDEKNSITRTKLLLSSTFQPKANRKLQNSSIFLRECQTSLTSTTRKPSHIVLLSNSSKRDRSFSNRPIISTLRSLQFRILGAPAGYSSLPLLLPLLLLPRSSCRNSPNPNSSASFHHHTNRSASFRSHSTNTKDYSKTSKSSTVCRNNTPP